MPGPADAVLDRLEPMLARSGPLPRDPEAWAFEVKWDGIRALLHVAGDQLEVRTRSGRVVTGGYPELAGLPAALDGREAVLDGEIVAFDAGGRPSFQALQPRMSSHGAAPGAGLLASAPVWLMLFDLLRLDGEDLVDLPWDERRARLDALALTGDAWSTPAAHPGEGEALLAETAKRGLEGIVAKRRDSPYRPGRRAAQWVKVKNEQRQEFVVGGFTSGTGARASTFGSLQVGVHDPSGELRLAGGVGTGFTEAVLGDLRARLRGLERRTSPFAGTQPPAGTTFVEPRLVCEVRFAEWTGEGHLRQASYRGLRDDRDAADVVREVPGGPDGAAAEDGRAGRGAVGRGRAATGGDAPRAVAPDAPPPVEIPEDGDHRLQVEGREVKVTNLGKVLWPDVPFTKGDMLRYYARISPVLLPHFRDHPTTLKRHPDGVTDDGFYAKRADRHRPEWIETVRVESGAGKAPIDYALLQDLPSLLWAANLGAIELHPNLHLADALDRPRTLVFDLDPGPGTTIVECCILGRDIQGMLDELGLRAQAKTSGSKGLQLHVPLDRAATYEATKAFAHAVAALLERRRPDEVVSTMAKARREGRVLVDWSQNDAKKTTVGVYSLRARPRPTVSTPVTWDEVDACAAAGDPGLLVFEADDVLRRAAEHGDRYADVVRLAQALPELRT